MSRPSHPPAPTRTAALPRDRTRRRMMPAMRALTLDTHPWFSAMRRRCRLTRSSWASLITRRDSKTQMTVTRGPYCPQSKGERSKPQTEQPGVEWFELELELGGALTVFRELSSCFVFLSTVTLLKNYCTLYHMSKYYIKKKNACRI